MGPPSFNAHTCSLWAGWNVVPWLSCSHTRKPGLERLNHSPESTAFWQQNQDSNTSPNLCFYPLSLRASVPLGPLFLLYSLSHIPLFFLLLFKKTTLDFFLAFYYFQSIFIPIILVDGGKGGIIFPILEVKKLKQRQPSDQPVFPQCAKWQNWGEIGSWLCAFPREPIFYGSTELSSFFIYCI